MHTDHALVAHDETSGTVKTISGTALNKCNIDSGLCFIDFFEPNQDDSPRCIKNIFLEKSFNEINNACNFRCEPVHNNIIVKKIKSNTFIISNPQDTLVLFDYTNNATKPLKLNNTLTGTIKLTLPCEKSLLFINKTEPEQNEVIIPRMFPCSKFNKEIATVTRILPLQWTNLDTVHISRVEDPSMTFTNLDKIINHEWKNIVPNFNIKTSQSEIETRLKNLTLKHIPQYQNKFIIETLIIIWLATISGILIIFGIIIWKSKIEIKNFKDYPHPTINLKKVRKTIENENSSSEGDHS